MPRLQKDFLNTPGSLSSSSFNSSDSNKPSSPTVPAGADLSLSPPHSAQQDSPPPATRSSPSNSPPGRLRPESISLPVDEDEEEVEEEIRVPQARPRFGLGRPVLVSKLASSPVSLSAYKAPQGLTSIREESRSISLSDNAEEGAEDVQHTPMPRRFLTTRFTRRPESRTSDHDDDENRAVIDEDPMTKTSQYVSLRATPAETPPTRKCPLVIQSLRLTVPSQDYYAKLGEPANLLNQCHLLQ